MNYYAGPSLVQGTGPSMVPGAPQDPEKPSPYPGMTYSPQANLPPGGSTYPGMSPQGAVPSGYPGPQPQPGYPNPGLYQATLNNYRPATTMAYVNQSSYPAVSSVYLPGNIGGPMARYAVSAMPGAQVGAYPSMHPAAQNPGYPSSYLARGAMTSVTNSAQAQAYQNLQPARGFIYPGAPGQAAQQMSANPYAGGVYPSQAQAAQAAQLYPGGAQYIPRP